MAGDFEISIKDFEVEDGHLVMVGRMGVWDARTYITPRELVAVLSKLLHPAVLFYLLRLPLLVCQRKANQPPKAQKGEP